ncbi:MAG TPA: RelA/SpoT family protein [Treponemataceae bacterium]|nr:RelA/SpoT family protein [Treponemataceae bacterium]
MNESIETFLHDFSYFSPLEEQQILKAWSFMSERKAQAKRPCGEAYLDHPLRVARILAELRLAGDSMVCAILHGSMEELGLTQELLKEEFGSSVTILVEGTSRISVLKLKNKSMHQAESIRKMFFAMVNDIRIIIIRLADRLDKMRTLKNFPLELQKPIAQETIDIWAPLANRLGISSIKDELEDLSLKFLNKEVYEQIKSLVASKKSERSHFLSEAEKKILKTTEKAGIHVQVKSRAKHFWSIYQKMKKRNKAADELYDLLAIRILCDSVNDCYTMLGLVHTIWKPLDGRFKDYIAMPKPNGYQSLHTTVLSIDGRPLEIQIRTEDMHFIAENGVASHWLYKKGKTNEKVSEDYLSVINQLKELSTLRYNDEDFLTSIKSDILGDSIYVFTPKGDIMELPAGSTAIDFAYNIHTAIGEKIVGAKANGSIIPLSEPLKNTQVIDIITHPQAHPTQNQYNNAHTAKARQKIRAWLAEAEPEKVQTPASQPIPPTLHHKGKHQGEPETSEEREFDTAVLKIRIGDTTNFMIKFAQCCKPIPPLPIIGYVSRGRGIIIHKQDCSNLSKIHEIQNRSITVEWDAPKEVINKKKK